jgi:signal transduction histidine kinase
MTLRATESPNSAPTRALPDGDVPGALLYEPATEQFLDAFPAHIAWLDLHGKILWANRRWREFAVANGMREDSAGVGDNYVEICLNTRGLEREQAHAAAAGIQKVLRGDAAEYSMEYPCHSLHERRWFQLLASPLGVGQGAMVMHLNVTAARLAQLDLQRLNSLYAVAAGVNEAIVRISDEQRLLQEVCRIAVEKDGLALAWVGLVDAGATRIRPVASSGLNKGYLEAVAASPLPAHPLPEDPVCMAFATGAPASCNDMQPATLFGGGQQARQNGYASCAAFPLKVQDQTAGVFALLAWEADYFGPEKLNLLNALAENLSFAIEQRRDEERRKQLAGEFRQSQALLRIASRVGRIGAWTVDLPDRAVTLSAETCVILDLPAGFKATTSEIAEHYAPNHRAGVSAAFEACVQHGTAYDIEAQIVLGNGNRVWTRTIGEAQRDEEGKVCRIQGALQDITSRKQVEAQSSDLRLELTHNLKRERDEIARLNEVLEQRVALRTQQLQIANDELEAFSYSIAHDLRSPLGSINGFGKLLERAMPADASERARHYLRRIGSGAVRMGEMIDALLALAQLSRAGLHWGDVNLYVLADAVFAGLQESEPGRRVQLELGEGPQVSGDSRLLKMVMENLLGNAWKFSARQPNAKIAFGQEPGANGQTHYFVRDNGIGFDMAHAGKLFGAFERMHGSSDFAGHGIGLANVKRIINRHGGRIWAESVPGQGATFYFTLGEPPLPPAP